MQLDLLIPISVVYWAQETKLKAGDKKAGTKSKNVA